MFRRIKRKKFPKFDNPDRTLQLLSLKAIADHIKNIDHYLHPSTLEKKLEMVEYIPYPIRRWIKRAIITYKLHVPLEYTMKCRINNCTYSNINEHYFRAHQYFRHKVTIYPYRWCPVCSRTITEERSCWHITTGRIPPWMKQNIKTKCWCGKRFHSRQQYLTHFNKCSRHKARIENPSYTQ